MVSNRARPGGHPRRASPDARGRERCSCSAGSPARCRNLYASGGYGFLHDMLEIAGGDDVFSRHEARVGAGQQRDVLARAPEVIIELPSEDERRRDLERLAGRCRRCRRSGTSASSMLTGSDLVTAGPRVGQAATATRARRCIRRRSSDTARRPELQLDEAHDDAMPRRLLRSSIGLRSCSCRRDMTQSPCIPAASSV